MMITLMIIVLIIIALFTGKIIQSMQHNKDVDELFSLSGDFSNRTFSYQQLADLPEPVQRYFKYSLQENQPYVSYVRLRHGGDFRLKPDQKWMSIKGEEYFTIQKIGFLWFGKLPLSSATDLYIDGRGKLKAKLLSLFTVVNAQGKNLDQSELLRWLGESPWYPTALLPSKNVKWEAINHDSAKAILSDNNLSVECIFHFNKQGQITHFTTKRYMDDSLENWTGYYRNYQMVNGMQIPYEVEAVYNLKSGDYSYAKFNLIEIEYDKPNKFK